MFVFSRTPEPLLSTESNANGGFQRGGTYIACLWPEYNRLEERATAGGSEDSERVDWSGFCGSVRQGLGWRV
jgi:hypothetical protein